MPPISKLIPLALLLVGSTALTSCEPARTPESRTDLLQAEQAIAATIQDIVASPVSVTLGQSEPVPAELNQAMTFGDRIATQDQALAEVGLANGAIFRIGGDASLTLQPNQLLLNSGQMITWVEGAVSEPLEIVTPAGIAGIRGTTVFVNIADDPAAPVEFFAWEGQVAVRLPDSAGEIVLNSGEQLLVPPGTLDLSALEAQPLDPATARQRLENSPLINGFSRPIPTRPAIEATVDALD
ncbi:FecR family protein [Nodosilinea sp. E11]|uniref:FecR family protein n=1 Tax=Nodosilinea sp. E11 TaxID=3037479 RepID=UPI002934D05A|nr:FecR family protein [Nodosilinea sp. E11]WOD37481.1 FecR family protein [Nodosilinea sp. E11]